MGAQTSDDVVTLCKWIVALVTLDQHRIDNQPSIFEGTPIQIASTLLGIGEHQVKANFREGMEGGHKKKPKQTVRKKTKFTKKQKDALRASVCELNKTGGATASKIVVHLKEKGIELKEVQVCLPLRCTHLFTIP